MSVPDELRREIVAYASRMPVWRALTEPGQLTKWFPTHEAEMDLRPGGIARSSWDENTDEAIIDVVESFEQLVFRWRPEGLDRPYTTVSIMLTDAAEGGTHVVLVESGFASLPGRIYEQSYEGNDKGWVAELAELKAYLEAAA